MFNLFYYSYYSYFLLYFIVVLILNSVIIFFQLILLFFYYFMLIIDLSMYSFISFIIMYLNLLNNKDVFVDIIKFIIMNDDDHMDLQVIVMVD